MNIVEHELIEFFSKDKLNFGEFYEVPPKKPSLVFIFNEKLNIDIKNEIKWWLQNQRVVNNLAGSTLVGFCNNFVSKFSKMLIEKHPTMKSIIELPYDVIYTEFKQYLVDNNYKIMIRLGNKSHISANMEYKTYYCKSDSLYQLENYYKFVDSFYNPDEIFEKDKDIWDIRKLGIKYNVLPSRPRYTINYTNVKQDWLRQAIKDYNYIRIPKQAISTVLDDMKAFNLLSEFLSHYTIEIGSMSEIDRNTAKAFIRYLRTKRFESTTYNRRISAIKTFIEIGNIFELEGFPTKVIFTKKDFAKRVRKLPVPFSDDELRQINANMDKLSYPMDAILFVIERHGLRMSDMCSATINVNGKYCLKKIDEDNILFTYYQIKTHKTNVISVDSVVAGVIEKCIEMSKESFGDDAKYIFSKDKNLPVGEETFIYHLNKLCMENNITGDNGELLRIKGHTFRRTLATDYANMGMDLNIIKSLLGQSKMDVLTHYIKIHGVEMNRYIQPITEENNELIACIGKEIDPISKEEHNGEYLPLSCGYCSKKVNTGICDHANACYSCKMFIPLKSKLPLYKKQLVGVEISILVCQTKGYERLLEKNLQLRTQLQTIIFELEKEIGYEDRQNSRTCSREIKKAS